MFSARVWRKCETVGWLALLVDFCSSATTALLSAEDRVGVERMAPSLVSLASRAARAATVLAVGSRVDVLTAAVYYTMLGGVTG